MALKASIDLRSGVNRFASPPQIPDKPSNYGRVPDIGGNGGHGVMSMDNPEYILDSKKATNGGGRGRNGGRGGNYDLKFPPNSNSGNYHTLGIPLVNNGSSPSHSSSQGPSSIQSAPPAAAGPYSSITSTGSGGHEVTRI